jgi:hypothetical protein
MIHAFGVSAIACNCRQENQTHRNTLAKRSSRHLFSNPSIINRQSSILKPFPALIAKCGTGQIFGIAVGAGPDCGFFVGPMTALGTELGVWREILAAVDTLIKDDLLMPAMRAEFCVL